MYLSSLFRELELVPSDAWDCHLHGWLVDHTPWLRNAGPILEQDYDPGRLKPLLEESGIARAVIIQALDPQDGGDAEADRFIEWVKQNGFLSSAVVSANLEEGRSVEPRLRALANSGCVSGIRIIKPQDHGAGILDSKQFLEAANLLPKYDLHLEWLIRERNPDQLEETIRAFDKLGPSLLIMGDHLLKPIDIDTGRPTKRWRSAIQELARRPNFWMKLSALSGEASPGTPAEKYFPFYDHALECFGAERLVFGSDYPVSALRGTYADAIALHLHWLVRSGQQRLAPKLFSENPRRFYGRRPDFCAPQ